MPVSQDDKNLAVRIYFDLWARERNRPSGEAVKEELAKRNVPLGKMDKKTVSNTITEQVAALFTAGALLPSASRMPTHGPPIERREELEERLVEKYEGNGLRKAIVVSADSAVLTNGHNDVGLPDNGLHRCLGKALAAWLRELAVALDGQTLGIGSGRGVGFTVDELRGQTLLPSRPSILSLTGSVHSKNAHKQYMMDADIHAAVLSACFSSSVDLTLIRRFAAVPAPGAPRKGTPLDDAAWEGHIPFYAILGVGTFAEGHKFFEEAKADPGNQEPHLSPIHSLLVELMRQCEGLARDDYSPVADIANHLVFIEDRRVLSIKAERIKGILVEINSRMVALQEAQFRTIRNIILVGGTKSKAGAIRHLLMSENFNVKAVCTDETVARVLLCA